MIKMTSREFFKMNLSKMEQKKVERVKKKRKTSYKDFYISILEQKVQQRDNAIFTLSHEVVLLKDRIAELEAEKMGVDKKTVLALKLSRA